MAASKELAAANERHARDIQDKAHLQAQLGDQKARLDVAQVQLVERDRRITHLEAALASETARGTDLASQLRASQISTDQLAALRADVLSSLAESQKNNQRAEQIGAD
jgi:septal ring factor EnvC (AmiA/AmiB activator)